MTLDVLVFGIITGAVIALGSLGMAMIFGQYRFLNFAYGEFLTVGAYIYLAIGGLSAGWVGIVASAMVVGVLGVLSQQLVFKPLVDRGPITMTVASMGLGFGAQAVIGAIWGTSVQSVEIPRLGWSLGPFDDLQVTIGVTVVVLALLTAALLYGTATGRQLRAASDNRTLASVSGVNLRRVGLLTWGLGGALAAVAGVLTAAYGQLTPTMGFLTLFPIIAAVLISGGGNPFRAAAGGFVIGIASECGAVFVGSAYKPAMAIVALAAALLFLAFTSRKVRV
jgi:branched-subunit amino acid ABC-type transport system permease component